MSVTPTSDDAVPARVLVVDDQPLMRKAIADFFADEPGFEVVGVARDGVEAVEVVAQLRPDVVLMDLDMHRMNGTDATRAIVDSGVPTKVVALTTFSVLEWVIEALRAGASGYLVKDADPADLVDAVRGVLDDTVVMSPRITALLVDSVVARPPAPAPADAPVSLTEREREVIDLLAGGLNNREMADELHLSEGAVKLHLSKACDRLGARDRVQLLVRAVELGLVDPSLRYPDTAVDRYR